MRRSSHFNSLILLTIVYSGCADSAISDPSFADITTAEQDNATTHEAASDYTWDDVTDITLDDSVTISSGGTYRVSGTLDPGQLLIDAGDATVKVILDGVSITNGLAPINIQQAGKVVLIIAEGSTNTVTDTGSSNSEELDGTIFSADDLTIFGAGDGSGKLLVNSNHADGIVSKDGLILKNAQITVLASVDDGIRGKDYLVAKSSTITITATADGMKSTNNSDDSMGYLSIEGGTYTITSGNDALQAETDLIIYGGDFDITTGGGAGASLGSDVSAKGLKGEIWVAVADGLFVLDTADDALHSDENIVIDNGTFDIRSGDDAVHAELVLTLNDGDLSIESCYEGLEAAAITIHGGSVYATTSDDGINVVPGTDRDGEEVDAGNLWFYGGSFYLNTTGDGIDTNGSFFMEDGELIISGPTAKNGPLDCDGSFEINGGFLAAAGSSSMAEEPSSSSAQPSLSITYGEQSGRNGDGGSTLAAGTLFHILSDDGTTLLAFSPENNYQLVVFSSPSLTDGTSGNIYTGGSCSEGSNYLCSGSPDDGTLQTSFSISDQVTSVSF